MALHIYNTKSRSIEEFIPLKEGIVTMYACGPTVYDYTHIGHMRKYIGDDFIRRSLNYIGYTVHHVMNVTDVGHLTNDSDEGDDKFEKKALSEGTSVWDVAKLYTLHFHESMHAIHVLPPNIAEAKATEHISQMISLIKTLLEKGHAYETSTAVYFNTNTFETYGSFSGQSLSQKEEGARDDVVIDTEKVQPSDFALWFKRAGKFSDHSMYWPSPWGDGFPGWHIECSAMSMHYLGNTIDIHTGGIDHIPVHHENEIAQSECATGHEFVRYWVHHNFLQVEGEKMSKSKHNFYTLSDIEGHNIHPLSMRLLCMQTSYRKPLNFTWKALEAADVQLKKLQKFATLKEHGEILLSYKEQFIEALSDDINTAKAMAIVWAMIADEKYARKDRYTTLLSFDEVLGLNVKDVPDFFITPEASSLLEKMNIARSEKDFEQSDMLRSQLEDLGYKVEQTKEGVKLSSL